jgi:hypothetical protein
MRKTPYNPHVLGDKAKNGVLTYETTARRHKSANAPSCVCGPDESRTAVLDRGVAAVQSVGNLLGPKLLRTIPHAST